MFICIMSRKPESSKWILGTEKANELGRPVMASETDWRFSAMKSSFDSRESDLNDILARIGTPLASKFNIGTLIGMQSITRVKLVSTVRHETFNKPCRKKANWRGEEEYIFYAENNAGKAS